MTSIVRRATPSQQSIMRAVIGAVKNALDAHPGYVPPKWLANSVAKRAAGTLTAGWPDVLAARDSASSERGRAVAASTLRLPRLSCCKRKARRGPSLAIRRAPLVSALARPLRRLKQEDPVRAEIYIEVLRLIYRLSRE